VARPERACLGHLGGVMGNLEGVFELIRAAASAGAVEWLDVRNLAGGRIGSCTPPIPGGGGAPRVSSRPRPAGPSQEVISEFPFSAFLLGDNHPHVLALPFVLWPGLSFNLL
jgi:hypothetical protein